MVDGLSRNPAQDGPTTAPVDLAKVSLALQVSSWPGPTISFSVSSPLLLGLSESPSSLSDSSGISCGSTSFPLPGSWLKWKFSSFPGFSGASPVSESFLRYLYLDHSTDSPDDDKYTRWLQLYHPDASKCIHLILFYQTRFLPLLTRRKILFLLPMFLSSPVLRVNPCQLILAPLEYLVTCLQYELNHVTPTLFTSLGSSVVDENMLSIPDVATPKRIDGKAVAQVLISIGFGRERRYEKKAC